MSIMSVASLCLILLNRVVWKLTSANELLYLTPYFPLFIAQNNRSQLGMIQLCRRHRAFQRYIPGHGVDRQFQKQI